MKPLITAAFLSLLLALALSGAAVAQNPAADRIAALGDARLVYVDDTVITARDFGNYLSAGGVLPSGRIHDNLDTLTNSLESMIDQVIVFLNVDTTAMFSESKHNRRARWRQANVAGPVSFKHEIIPRIHVADSAVQKFYHDSTKTMFTAPQRRELRHLLVSPAWHSEGGKRYQYNEDREAAEKTADSLKRAIEAGASFAELAKEYSADSASRANGGYLGWVFPGNTVYNFDTAAFHAELGEIRGPVKTMYGYHLIRVEGIRPESTIVLTDSLAAMIRQQLQFQEGKRLGQIWADSILAAADFQYNDYWLDGRLDSAPDSAWMVAVNQKDTLVYGEWKGAWEFFKRTMHIEGKGTLDDKHRSLRKTAFPYLYLQAAEAHGYADDSLIAMERLNYARSVSLQDARSSLYESQRAPSANVEVIPPVQDEDSAKMMKLQMIRAEDTATIWAAYRALTAGDSMAAVARWYHDNMREVRQRAWDLGWVSTDDLPNDIAGKVWILTPGRFTRPIESGGKYFIYLMVDRRYPEATDLARQQQVKEAAAEYARTSATKWRADLRRGHTIRRNAETWRHIVRLFRL